MLKDAHSTVSTLLDEMKPLLLLSGCNPKHVRVADGDFKLKMYNDAYDWLHRIYLSCEYAAVKAVYDTRTPETWLMYEAMGTEGLWEQEAIAAAGVALKKLWRTKKPRLFGLDKEPPKDPYIEDEDDESTTCDSGSVDEVQVED